ncbi:MAG TPA: hypothetical protein VEE82_01685 [Thermodesulfovibrionales bacterium]|nr:hypothetical protein [Thermodesulfovibrionales bacterium]
MKTRDVSILVFAAVFFVLAGLLTNSEAASAAMTGDTAATASTTEPVPAEYQQLYNDIKLEEDKLRASLTQSGQNEHGNPTYATELLAANSNIGPGLLRPGAIDGVERQLDALQKMGITGVTFPIHYPIFMPDFPNASQYINFYQQVAEEIRKRGMKFFVETAVTFPPPISDITVDYSGLTLDSWKLDHLQMAQTIIDYVHPDYLNLGSEPDTDAALTGLKSIDDPKNWADIQQYVVQHLTNKGTTMVVAGVGTWLNKAPQFIQLLAAIPELDGIDIHIYPVNDTVIANVPLIVNLAGKANKPLSITEGWLLKVDPGVTNPTSEADDSRKEDCFSFWEPLDEEFLSNMVRLARTDNFYWVSPFRSTAFFAYLDWTPQYDSETYNQLLEALDPLVSQNMTSGQLTPTGLYYEQLIKGGQ